MAPDVFEWVCETSNLLRIGGKGRVGGLDKLMLGPNPDCVKDRVGGNSQLPVSQRKLKKKNQKRDDAKIYHNYF